MSDEEYLRLARVAAEGDPTDLLMFADLMEERGDHRPILIRRHARCCNRARNLVRMVAKGHEPWNSVQDELYCNTTLNNCGG